MDHTNFQKLTIALVILSVFYFIVLYLNTNYFKIDWVFIGVLQETLTIPLILLQPILIIAIFKWILYHKSNNKLSLFIEHRLHGHYYERYADWKLDAATRFLDLQLITNKYSFFLIVVLLLFSTLFIIGGYLQDRKYIKLALILTLVIPIYYAIDNVHIINNKTYIFCAKL